MTIKENKIKRISIQMNLSFRIERLIQIVAFASFINLQFFLPHFKFKFNLFL